jgi:hypothetical protein
MIEKLNELQKGWDAITLFQICRSKDNNILSRRQVQIKIDLEY